MPDLGLPLEDEFYPTQNMGPAQSLVVFLHGYGANGLDLINIASYLDKLLPDTAFYAPDGPQECEITPFGRQWFSLNSVDPHLDRRDPRTLPHALDSMHAGVLSAAPVLNSFIDAILDRHQLPAQKLALFCFSQGTMMGLHLALSRPDTFAGVFGYSGALTGPNTLQRTKAEYPPIWLIHGAADDMIPPQAMALARDALQTIGITAKTHMRPALAHGIDDAGLFIARDGLLEGLS